MDSNEIMEIATQFNSLYKEGFKQGAALNGLEKSSLEEIMTYLKSKYSTEEIVDHLEIKEAVRALYIEDILEHHQSADQLCWIDSVDTFLPRDSYYE